MNLVEHHILEVISEKVEVHGGKEFMVAVCKVNCYGRVSEDIHLASVDGWKEEKSRGWYLG